VGRAWCYSITWSARSRSVCGIVSPSDLGGDARRPARGALTLAMDARPSNKPSELVGLPAFNPPEPAFYFVGFSTEHARRVVISAVATLGLIGADHSTLGTILCHSNSLQVVAVSR
jgi:hypothetical protein